MKILKILGAMMILVFTTIQVNAQSNTSTSRFNSFKDSSITFKVFGVCVQCKKRIEGVVKGKRCEIC